MAEIAIRSIPKMLKFLIKLLINIPQAVFISWVFVKIPLHFCRESPRLPLSMNRLIYGYTLKISASLPAVVGILSSTFSFN